MRIAFAGVSTHRLVARLARAVRSQRPGIVLEMSSQNFAQPAMKRLLAGETDIALGRWDVIPAEVDARVVMRDSLVVAVPDTHALAGARRLSISQLSSDAFVSLPPLRRVGATRPVAAPGPRQRLRRRCRPDSTRHPDRAGLGQCAGRLSPDAGVGDAATSPTRTWCSFRSTGPTPDGGDVHLRAAWRRDDRNPALRAVMHELFALEDAATPADLMPHSEVSPTSRPS